MFTETLTNFEHKAEELIDGVSAATGLDPKAATVALVVLVLIAVFIFTKPIRLVFKLLLNTAVGFVALILIHKFGADFGISLAVNWQNAIVTGVFGIPGVAVLIALRWGGIL